MAGKDIVFVNGLVKSREKYLLTEEKLFAMADAPDAAEAFRLLRETGFGGEATGEAEDYENLISEEWKSLTAFLREYAPDAFLRCALARNDFFNAECAVRQACGFGGDESYMPEGTSAVAELKKSASGKPAQVPDYIAKTVAEALSLFKEDRASGVSVSAIFDRAYFAFMLKNVPNRFWKEAVVFEIDCRNLSVAFRSKSVSVASEQYIPGGKIPFADLGLIISGRAAKFAEKYAHTGYADVVRAGMEDMSCGRALVGFERMTESVFTERLKEKRFETEGLTPLLLYFNYKTNELKNVRVILALKLCGADKDSVRRRLRSNYAG